MVNKEHEMQVTIRDLIQMDIDIDVYDDVCGELAIAFCGHQDLTDEGQREFADIMDYTVIINYSGCSSAIICIDDDNDYVWRDRLARVKLFFESAAGWCSVDDYKKWFLES